MLRLLTVMLCLAAAGCVSSAVEPYEGKTFTDLRIDWGMPVSDFMAPDGRRIVQYRWGGGTAIVPGSAVATTIGPTTVINATPAMAVHSEGCLVSFIMKPEGDEWRVTEARYPQRLSC